MKETISTKKKVINDDKVAIIMAIVSGVIVIALSIFLICVTGFRTAQKFYVKEVELGNGWLRQKEGLVAWLSTLLLWYCVLCSMPLFNI